MPAATLVTVLGEKNFASGLFFQILHSDYARFLRKTLTY